MHGKRITLRSAKWGVTKQEQHHGLGASLLHDKGQRHGQPKRHHHRGRPDGPALAKTLRPREALNKLLARPWGLGPDGTSLDPREQELNRNRFSASQNAANRVMDPEQSPPLDNRGCSNVRH